VNTDVYYVESEISDNIYYFVKFKGDVIEYCTCPDNSMRGGGQMKCKHLHAIKFAIRLGTLKDTDRLPTTTTTEETNNKVRKVAASATTTTTVALSTKSSFTNDEYSF
jgi:predicted nucleic acid-binding Zn finger protein